MDDQGNTRGKRRGRRWDAAAAALLGALVFAYQVPIGIVVPTNLRWMMRIDRGAALSGWLFERNEPLTLPFGILHTLMAPLVTTVGYSDSLPLLAAPAKLLFGWVPVPWQYSGLFLLACYMLQALFGFLVLRSLGVTRGVSLLGAVLFALSPALQQRYEHISLSAHWEILAAWWLYLRHPENRASWQYLWPWLLLVSISIPTYGYLALMVGALAAAAYMRVVFIDRLFPWWTAARHAAVAGVIIYAVFWVFGYFVLQERGESGFGRFYADLLAFFNSAGSSRFLPAIPSMAIGWWGSWGLEWDGYELYYYLGLGMIALILVSVGLAVTRPRRGGVESSTAAQCSAAWPPLWPGVVVAVALFVYALSTPVRVAGHEWFSVPLYARFPNFTAWFRGSGRFAWPLYYLVMALTIAEIGRRLPGRVASGLLGAALLLQVLDMQPLRASVRRDYSYPWPQLEAPVWQSIGRSFRSLRLVPPIVHNHIACRHYDQPADYEIKFGVLAAEQGMAFNSAAPSRIDSIAPLCRPMIDSLKRGLVDDRTVFVPSAPYREAIEWWARGRVVCGTIEEANVCVARTGSNAEAPLTRLLLRQELAPAPTVLHFDLRFDDAGAVDSTEGFAPGDSGGRAMVGSVAHVYYTRPLIGPLTLTVDAATAAPVRPVPMTVELGGEHRTIRLGVHAAPDTLRFAGGPHAQVLRFTLAQRSDGVSPLASAGASMGPAVTIRQLTIRFQ